MRAVLVAVLLLVILVPVSAHGQELGESDAYYQAVIMSPEYGIDDGGVYATSEDVAVIAESVPIQAVQLPCTQYQGQQIQAYSTGTQAVADWDYDTYVDQCQNLGGPACAAAMQDKAYYAVSAYVGPGSLVSVPQALFSGASYSNELPPSIGRSVSGVWGVKILLDPSTIMPRLTTQPTPYLPTATLPSWLDMGQVILPTLHAVANDAGAALVQQIARGFVMGTGLIGKLIVQFSVPKLLLSTLRPTLKVCDRVETAIDVSNPTAIAAATRTAQLLATRWIGVGIQPSPTQMYATEPRTFWGWDTTVLGRLYTGSLRGHEMACDATNPHWCEVRLDARTDPYFMPVNSGDQHCIAVEMANRSIVRLCISSTSKLAVFNYSSYGLGARDRVRVYCIQSTVGWPCPARNIRFTAQMQALVNIGGDGQNLAATQTRQAVQATNTRAIATRTVTAGLVPTIPAYATNTATPVAATTATRTAIVRTATAQSINRTATAQYIIEQRQTATAYAAAATSQALTRGSATAQVAQTATAQLLVQQTAYAEATKQAQATATRANMIDQYRPLAGRDPEVLGEVLDEVNGRTSMDQWFTNFSGLISTLSTSLTGSPCSAPAGMSVLGVQLNAPNQWVNTDQLFASLCVIRTWLESEQNVIPKIRLLLSGIMILAFGVILVRMFGARPT
jgi:hypothetical protein